MLLQQNPGPTPKGNRKERRKASRRAKKRKADPQKAKATELKRAFVKATRLTGGAFCLHLDVQCSMNISSTIGRPSAAGSSNSSGFIGTKPVCTSMRARPASQQQANGRSASRFTKHPPAGGGNTRNICDLCSQRLESTWQNTPKHDGPDRALLSCAQLPSLQNSLPK